MQNPYQGQYQNNSYQGNNYQGNRGLYHNPHRNFQQGNNYGQFRGRSHGHGRGNSQGCSCGQFNYRGNANYQYHQYYGHDDEYQTDHMVHHVHYAVVITTLLNIVLRENMISMILWKR